MKFHGNSSHNDGLFLTPRSVSFLQSQLGNISIPLQNLQKLLGTVLLLLTCFSVVQAQVWSKKKQYDTGWNPSVAMSTTTGSTVVEVHNGQDGFGSMWYHVGQMNGYSVQGFGGPSSGINWGPANSYDVGYNPSVAVAAPCVVLPSSQCGATTVVEVHNGQDGFGEMWYHVGTVSGSQITWSPAYSYDVGYNPSVALTSCATTSNPDCLIAVEVHNGQEGFGQMWYHVGTVNGSQVDWSPAYSYDVGFNPSVAIQACAAFGAIDCTGNGMMLVEVHNGQAEAGPMWYHVGTWTSGSTITWGPYTNYDWGWNPKVALYNDGCQNGSMSVDLDLITEVHNGNDTLGDMWFNGGFFEPAGGTSIEFTHAEYDRGWNPSVAGAGEYAVEVHNGKATDGAMYYLVGYLGGC
jgi:hypothetical protein